MQNMGTPSSRNEVSRFVKSTAGMREILAGDRAFRWADAFRQGERQEIA
jgi:hypothetical protein